jgi:hypothetical protein
MVGGKSVDRRGLDEMRIEDRAGSGKQAVVALSFAATRAIMKLSRAADRRGRHFAREHTS